MYYLNLSRDGWLLSVSETPLEGCPEIESLEGADLSGVRMGAYRWDGGRLTLDQGRLAELEAEREAVKKDAWERESRAAAMGEVQDRLVAAQINTLAVDDATALRWRVLYPKWSPDGAACRTGEKYQRLDRLWRCRQDHTTQAAWAPELAPALWEEICESHAGTADDPIPYSGSMALEAGKYYSQDGVTYRCTRDTEIPVYNPLAELVGIYVERA